MDINNQAGTAGLKYAASKGLAVVVMEPILGGRLVEPPDPVQAVWDTAETERSAAEWALQWVWNQPEVSVVLSGMSTMQHVEENVASASRSGPGTLTDADLALVGGLHVQYGPLQHPLQCQGLARHFIFLGTIGKVLQVQIEKVFQLFSEVRNRSERKLNAMHIISKAIIDSNFARFFF